MRRRIGCRTRRDGAVRRRCDNGERLPRRAARGVPAHHGADDAVRRQVAADTNWWTNAAAGSGHAKGRGVICGEPLLPPLLLLLAPLETQRTTLRIHHESPCATRARVSHTRLGSMSMWRKLQAAAQ